MRVSEWLRWQRVPVAEMRIDRPQREAALALAYAVFYVFAAVITGLLVLRWPRPIWGAASFTQDYWYALLFKIGLLLIAPVVAFLASGYRFRDLLPGWRLSLRSATVLLVAWFIGFYLNFGHMKGIWGAAERFTAQEFTARIALGVALPLVTAGIPEEFFYRGILQTRLEAIWGRLAAIAVTAVLFTAWHLPTRHLLAHGVEGQAGDFGSVLLGTGLPVFVVGLAFGLLWDRYRSLLPLIAVHWGIDTLPTVSSLLGVDF